MKISVVISAFNEEKKIEACLESVKKIADEIIFIDNSSTDKTPIIARKFTDKVFIRENNTMLNVNKNFGFQKAANEWILSLDADERVTPELADEILSVISNQKSEISGYYIPRKNIIFGKWIKNTGWYPDYQLRLFKKSAGRFEEKQVHEMLSIDGSTEKLTQNMEHLNYESISQFLEKMVRVYTVSEADNLISSGYKLNLSDIVSKPLSEFMKRYFFEKGYMDSFHGLALSLLMAFYHLVVFLRVWEQNGYPETDNSLKIVQEGSKKMKREYRHWLYQSKIDETSNVFKKNTLRIKRKTSSLF